MELGFEKSPPAYLTISSEEQGHLGVNFASGGSGILDTTVSPSSTDSFV